MTSIIAPMLGKAGKLEDVCNDAWIFEPKYDGFRCVVEVGDGGLTATVRIGRNSAKTANVPYIEDAVLCAVAPGTILDGELYSPEKGWGHTSGVIKRKKPHDLEIHGPALKFAIFDVIKWNGEDLRAMEFSTRRKTLEEEIPKGLLTRPNGVLRRAPSMPPTPETYAEVVDMGFEGIMAKRLTGTYRSGKRSRDLIKVKVQNTVDVVVTEIYPAESGSWLEKEGLPGKLGYRFADEDKEAGLVGTGFKRYDRELIRDNPENWIGHVIEIGHMTVDDTEKLRHPAFMRKRDDKSPSQASTRSEAKGEGPDE